MPTKCESHNAPLLLAQGPFPSICLGLIPGLLRGGAADPDLQTSCQLTLAMGARSAPSLSPYKGQVSKGILSGHGGDSHCPLSMPKLSAVDFEALPKDEPRRQQK